MAAEWFYQVMGQQLGPVSAVELRALANAGTVQPDTLVRKGTDGCWVWAEKVQGVFRPSGSRAAQAVPLSGTKPTGRATVPLAEQKSPVPPPLPASHIPTAGTSGKLGEDRSDNRGRMFKPVPYSIIFAWGWTLFIGYIELFCGLHSPMLRPCNLPFLFGLLLVPVLILVGPTLHIIISEWRKTKSPAVLWLIGIIAVVILGQVVQLCRPPEAVSGLGWSAGLSQREEWREAIGRVEDHFDNRVGPKADEAGEVIGTKTRSVAANASGVLDQLEQLMMETVDLSVKERNDYLRELKSIGADVMRDASWLRNDKGLRKSRTLVEKGRKVVERYRAKQSSLLATMRSKVVGLKVDPGLTAEALLAFDRSAKACQPKMDMYWKLESKSLGEFEKILDLLDARWNFWSAVNGQVVFQRKQDTEAYNAILARIQQHAAEEEKLAEQVRQECKSDFSRMKEGL